MSNQHSSPASSVVHRFMLISGCEGALDDPVFFETHEAAFRRMLTQLALETLLDVNDLLAMCDKDGFAEGDTFSFSPYAASYCRNTAHWNIFCIAVDCQSHNVHPVENWPDADILPDRYHNCGASHNM